MLNVNKSRWRASYKRYKAPTKKSFCYLFFPSEIFTVSITDWSGFRRLTGKICAFEAESDMSMVCTGCYLAEWIVSWYATCLFVWTGFIGHLWAFFTGDTAYTNFHRVIPSFHYDYFLNAFITFLTFSYPFEKHGPERILLWNS